MTKVFGSNNFLKQIFIGALLSGISLFAFAGLSPEARVGERLFSEPRFAQFFQQHSGGKINSVLTARDPALVATSGYEPGVESQPKAKSISCASCHLSDENRGRAGWPAHGVNSFGGFLTRSPVTSRKDGDRTTTRNAPSLVGVVAGQLGGWGLLHWDGEFSSMEDLVIGTATGRNFGWLPEEQTAARHHFVRVIREDDGSEGRAGKQGQLSYAQLLCGQDPAIPAQLRLSPAFRFDPVHATEEEILRGCAKLISAFVGSLDFSRDQNGVYAGSPYDVFLALNRLPRTPNPGEVPQAYARRLHAAVAALKNPQFVDEPARKLELRDQEFRFGEFELRGMKLFFRGALGSGATTSAGNCAECHVPPSFTDVGFHNTGEAQESYDGVHGAGAFSRLIVPGRAERQADSSGPLPPTARHQEGKGGFLSVVTTDAPGHTDLGLWNVYGNLELPAPQPVIEQKLNHDGRLSGEEVLALTLGRFKTSGLRDLGQSAPYLHTGRLRSLEEIIAFYQRVSDLAHEGQLRNPPPEFSAMKLGSADVAPLVAFLHSLNEDYQGPR